MSFEEIKGIFSLIVGVNWTIVLASLRLYNFPNLGLIKISLNEIPVSGR